MILHHRFNKGTLLVKSCFSHLSTEAFSYVNFFFHTKISPLHAPRNIKLSKLFSELAKEHKSSPLDDIDEWRYYMFTLISGRVKKLHFEIVYNEEVFKNLKKIKGFGNSIISKIKEFLLTGKCERLQELRKDPLRIAMKNMMSIWGVGRVKVRIAFARIAFVQIIKRNNHFSIFVACTTIGFRACKIRLSKH